MPAHLNGRLCLEYVPIESLKLNPRNARKHPRSKLTQLASNIRTFSFIVPIVVDQHDRILGGHARIQAARQVGMTEIPIVRLHHLTPVQAEAFAIADNRLTELASWADLLLGEIFSELSSFDLDFSLEITGFSVPEIDGGSLVNDALSRRR